MLGTQVGGFLSDDSREDGLDSVGRFVGCSGGSLLCGAFMRQSATGCSGDDGDRCSASTLRARSGHDHGWPNLRQPGRCSGAALPVQVASPAGLVAASSYTAGLMERDRKQLPGLAGVPLPGAVLSLAAAVGALAALAVHAAPLPGAAFAASAGGLAAATAIGQQRLGLQQQRPWRWRHLPGPERRPPGARILRRHRDRQRPVFHGLPGAEPHRPVSVCGEEDEENLTQHAPDSVARGLRPG
mmetsp:Transcript_100699/g.215846  ORF Transcript_100699/g.215846 Transcript_100699/m.215846 type:complete len:242 (-) Transcript_100699:990-1715(-)